MMEFLHPDWFGGRENKWNEILSKFKNKSDLRFLEIGTYEGRSAIWLLENILTKKTSKLICVDSWDGLEKEYTNFVNNIQVYKDKVIIRKGYSGIELRKIKSQIDFVYIDGSHTAKDVLEDSILVWRLLKIGGILIWDDYLWDAPRTKGIITNRPQIAIESFLQMWIGEYRILHKELDVNIGTWIAIEKI